MAPNTSVKGNRIVYDDRVYETKVLGGGKFDVFKGGVRVGGFTVRGRELEAEDLQIEGVDPIETIGLLWASGNLSTRVEGKRAIEAREVASVAAAAAAAAAAAEAAVEAQKLEAQAQAAAKAANPTVTWPTCRFITHDRPDAAAFKKALAYQAWLRTQPGVKAAYLTHDNATGKTVSVTIWETREQLAAMRYAQPPPEAVALKPLTVEDLWVVG
jgi:hypothetical protein